MYTIITVPYTDKKIIKRIADNAFIPFDDANADYRDFAKWIDEGNTPVEEITQE